MAELLKGSRRRAANKIVRDYSALARAVEIQRALGRTIVGTIGTWDVLHIGHVRYLYAGKEYGDILVVGADTDRAVKLYKDPKRPMIPEDERLEMLTYLDCVEYVTTVDDVEMVDGKGAWQYGLLRAVRFDVFVAVEHSYPEEQLHDIRQHCGNVVVLPRQAETSTSQFMRENAKLHLQELMERMG